MDRHKRREKRLSGTPRNNGERLRGARILIVCEGKKTEPRYLKELIQSRGLGGASIKVHGGRGSDPLGVFKYSGILYEKSRETGNPFDRVYCVFDKDNHAHYKHAVDAIHNARPEGIYVAITSVPCFEYWLLLHFHDTTRPYSGKSPCTQLIKDLKKHIPAYQKGYTRIFSDLLPKLETAKQNAEHALQAAKANNTDNPSTRMHELVDYLQNVRTP